MNGNSESKVLNKAKEDYYDYFLHLSNEKIIHFMQILGPYSEGGKTWYDIYDHDLDNMKNRSGHKVKLRNCISINADHIMMISEADS